MSAADWGILIPAIVAILTAGASFLRARSANTTANNAQKAVNDHLSTVHNPPNNSL